MNKTAIVTWVDDFNIESYKLCQLEYDLKVLKTTPTDGGLELVVFGTEDNVNEFLEDLDEGRPRPLEQLSLACDTDDDYVDVLAAKIAEFDSYVEMSK